MPRRCWAVFAAAVCWTQRATVWAAREVVTPSASMADKNSVIPAPRVQALTPSQVAELLKSGDSSFREDIRRGKMLVRGVRCRIVCLPPSKKLKFNPEKTILIYLGKFAFTAGSDYLNLIVGKSEKEWLYQIGFDPEWINAEGKSWSFKMIIFREDENATQTNWENVLDIILPRAFPGQENSTIREMILRFE